MASPILVVYPKTSGPGRLTEIATFKRSNIPSSEWEATFAFCMSHMKTLPIARQTLYGRQIEDSSISVLVADWTSAEEKDIVEPTDAYQSVKPRFGTLVDAENPTFACHHLIVPGGAETPVAGAYLAEFWTVEKGKQGDFARRMERLLGETETKPIFYVGSVAREGENSVVTLSGWESEEATKKFLESAHFLAFEKDAGEMGEKTAQYTATLMIR